jgi:predicted methyltransferase
MTTYQDEKEEEASIVETMLLLQQKPSTLYYTASQLFRIHTTKQWRIVKSDHTTSNLIIRFQSIKM